MKTLPTARQERLVVQELPEETLIYDLDRDKAHCLNQTAAFVWKQCDGRTTPAELRQRLEGAFGPGMDEAMVWLALDQLEKFDLLQERIQRPAGMQRPSRRAVMRSMGFAALVAVPLITSIVAPSVHAVSSCAQPGDSCQGNGNCCSNNCEATAGHPSGTCAP
ncbi:MAG: hypothetical protein QOD75_3118 [Blastocatellia bacterium]|jgi:hypothetical protein|nr:hypothetical protein [Blastocatellia bacterium]